MAASRYKAENPWMPMATPDNDAALARATFVMMEIHDRLRPLEPLPFPEPFDTLEDDETSDERSRACLETGS